MNLRHLALACLIPLPWLIACDRNQPVGPSLEARATAAGGPTVKAPSNANASALSESRIDVSWQDNATNETGFEVWRSPSGLDGTFTKLAGTGANVTKYSDGGLSPVMQYCYRVRAFRNYDGKTSYSDFSNTPCATTLGPPLPAAPSNVSAAPFLGYTIRVTWTDNAGNESGFRVERSATSSGPWTAFGPTDPNVVSFDDNQPPAAEQSACYRVFAFNSFGDSPSSNVDCTALPNAPSGLVAAATGSDVDLNWTDNSGVEDGFFVYRWTASTGTPVVVATLPANATAYHEPGLSDGTYLYQVRARKDGGTSGASNTATAVVATVSPAAPSGTDALPSSSTVAAVTWVDNVTNEAGFRVKRSTDGGASWVAAGTVGADETWFYDSGQPSEPQQVCYRVIAFNALGESPTSNADCTTLPLGPTDLIVTEIDESTIDLTWTDNSAVEDGYEVWACYYNEGGWCYLLVATLPANTTSWRHYNSSYYNNYYIVATKDGGHSSPSNEVDRW